MSEWKETEIGRLPHNWEISTLNEISDVITDGAHKSPKPIDSEFLMPSVKDMRYNHFNFENCKTISEEDFDDLVKNNCSPQKGDILISKDGANCLDLIFVYNQPEKVVLLSSIAIARLKEGYNPKFYCYYLLSPNIQYLMRNNFISGSAIPRVVLKDFRNVPVPIISYEEQKAIATILSSLDEKIDLLHRQNGTLEGMAEVLFREWFVERDYSKKISDIIEIQNGYAFKGKDLKGFGENRVIKIRNISGGIIDIFKADFISEKVAKSIHDKFLIKSGDILFAMTGAKIGKMGIVPKNENKLWLNQRVGLFREKFEGSRFLAYLQLKSDYGQDYIENTATGSAQPNISATGIEDCGFPEFSEEEIINYSKTLLPMYTKLIFNLGQLRKIEKLRDTLLPKLMSGEVRVKF